MSHSEEADPYEHEHERYQRVGFPGIEPERHIDAEIEGHVHHGAKLHSIPQNMQLRGLRNKSRTVEDFERVQFPSVAHKTAGTLYQDTSSSPQHNQHDTMPNAKRS